MNRVEVPADAITFEEYVLNVASAEIDALENALEIKRAARGRAEMAHIRAILRAREELRDRVYGPLRAGSVVAYGEPFGGFPIAEVIPAKLREHLEFEMGSVIRRPYCGLNDVWCGTMENSPGFHNVRIAKEMLSPEERCRIWLREQVAAGGQEKPKFKRGGGIDTAATSYWGEAQSRFGISKKRFVAIWAEETRGHVA